MVGAANRTFPEAENNGRRIVLEELVVHLVHALPGRMRLRIPLLQQHPEFAGQITEAFSRLELLESIEINEKCGSVVLHFPEEAHEHLVSGLCELFPKLRSTPPDPSTVKTSTAENADLAAGVSAFFAEADRKVKELTGGMDLKLLVPLLLLLLSALGVLLHASGRRRLPTPSWYDFLWFAFNTFVILNITLKNHDEKRLSLRSSQAEK